jgi:hypothetical protein
MHVQQPSNSERERVLKLRKPPRDQASLAKLRRLTTALLF